MLEFEFYPLLKLTLTSGFLSIKEVHPPPKVIMRNKCRSKKYSTLCIPSQRQATSECFTCLWAQNSVCRKRILIYLYTLTFLSYFRNVELLNKKHVSTCLRSF